MENVTQTAEIALDNSLAMQDKKRDLQSDMTWTNNRVLTLDLASCVRNLKFRGFAETYLKVLDLIASWLVAELKRETMEDVGIEKAFCIALLWELSWAPQILCWLLSPWMHQVLQELMRLQKPTAV